MIWKQTRDFRHQLSHLLSWRELEDLEWKFPAQKNAPSEDTIRRRKRLELDPDTPEKGSAMMRVPDFWYPKYPIAYSPKWMTKPLGQPQGRYCCGLSGHLEHR